MKTFKKISDETADLRLTQDEKRQVRQRLVSFMDANPVRINGADRLHVRRPFIYFFNFKSMPALALLLVLFTGLGTSFAAESALPGDALYPVKIHVNEEVQGWFVLSSESKADFEAKRAERRLEEAEKLAAKGEVKGDVLLKLEKNFDDHANKVLIRIDKLKNRNNAAAAAEVSSRFETSLRAHQAVMERLTEVDGLTARIKAKVKVVNETRENDEDDAEDSDDSDESGPDTRGAAEGKLQAATNKIAEVRAYYESKKGELNATVKTQIEARLADAENEMAKGKTELDAKAYANAFMKFELAKAKAQDITGEVNSSLRIEVNDEDEDGRSRVNIGGSVR